MGGNDTITYKKDKTQQQLDDIHAIGTQLVESSHNCMVNGVNDADASIIVWNAHTMCKIMGNDHELVEAWLIDAICMELDNMYDNSMEGIKNMVNTIERLVKWVKFIKTM